MLTYLSYLAVPREERPPTIKIVSKMDGCLAFKAEEELSQGVHRVACRTGRGPMSFKVDVYRYDAETGLHEARLIGGSAKPYSPDQSNEPSKKALFGHMQEKFVSGATVRVDTPLQTDAYLRVEVENTGGKTDVKLGRILWVQEVNGGKFDVRLSFMDKSKLKELPKSKYRAVS